MEKVIEAIKAYYEKNEWNYEYDEEGHFFSSGINMGNILGNVKMYIYVEQASYRVLLVLNSRVEEKYYNTVGEFLHRANFGLKNGNFEMDYNDGQIRYKTFVKFKDREISQETVEDSVMVGIAMIDRYGKGLLKLMLGDGTTQGCVE